MKAETIKSKISLYDHNKGIFRMIKDEPHVKELRDFCSKLEGIDTLSPALLLELAGILLGKNDRDGDSESSQIFRKLVHHLGGYDALENLSHHGQLTAENVAFLEKNHNQAELLAPLLVSIGRKLPPSTKNLMLHTAEMISERDRLVELFKYFEKFAYTEDAVLYFETISFLNRYGIKTEDAVPLLSEVKQIVSIKQALEVLYRINPQLFNRDNVLTILKLQNPYYFYKVFDLLSNTQDSLNRLFAVDCILDKCSRVEEIIKNFKRGGWELEPYLKYILSTDRNGVDLESATGRLLEIKIKPELLPLILETIFARSNESIALVEAVALLNGENYEEDMLNIAFANKYPDRVAAAIVQLRKEKYFNEQTCNVICSHPEHAIGLAQALVQLHQINYTARAAYEGILKYPQAADKVARVIEYLQKNSILDNLNVKPEAYIGLVKRSFNSIILAVCKADLADDSLIKIFETMKAAKLYDISNLHKLMPRLRYAKTLASAANCLANGNKLDQLNFDSIISDPINSISLAENLGGIPSSPSLPKRIDEGAKDFVEIRKAAKVLAQGQRQGLFFTNLDPEKTLDFEKATHKKMAAMYNETMMKIAEYTSEHHLEKLTEQHISNNSYFSVLRPK